MSAETDIHQLAQHISGTSRARQWGSDIRFLEGIVQSVGAVTAEVYISGDTTNTVSCLWLNSPPNVNDYVIIAQHSGNARYILGTRSGTGTRALGFVTSAISTTATGSVSGAVDLGLSVTFTAQPGRLYRYVHQGAIISSTAATRGLCTIANAANVAQGEPLAAAFSGGAVAGGLTFHWQCYEVVVAGGGAPTSVTRKAHGASVDGGGTVNWYADSSLISYLVVEDAGSA